MFFQKWLSFCISFSESIGRILGRFFLEFYWEEITKLKAHSHVLDNFLTTESPLKTKKNASYFTIKARSFPKIFKHLLAVKKLFPDSFLKTQNWVYLWINSPKFCAVCFYCMTIWGLSKYIETKPRPPAFSSYKAFLISISASFCAWFLKKNISLVIFY